MLLYSQMAEVSYGPSDRRDQRIVRTQAAYIAAHQDTSDVLFRGIVLRTLPI